jgi:hypothetical protein
MRRLTGENGSTIQQNTDGSIDPEGGFRMNARIYAVLTAALALLAPGVARADTTYKIQPIIKSGDRVGDFEFGPAKNPFIVVGLNDAGQLLFLGQNDAARSGILVQYASGWARTGSSR